MTAASTDSSVKSRAMRACMVLLLLLIPLATGALWVASHESHGPTDFCIIDREGHYATYIFTHAGYSATGLGVELRCRTFDVNSGKQVSDEKVFPGIFNCNDTSAFGSLGDGRFELYHWDAIPFANPPITFSLASSNPSSAFPKAFIDGLVLATEYKTDTTRIVLIDPKTSAVLDETEVAGQVDVHHWRRTNFVEISSPVLSGNTVSTRLRIEAGKISIDANPFIIANVSPADEFGQSYVITQSSDGKSLEVRSTESNDLRSSIEMQASLMNPLAITHYDGTSWVRVQDPSCVVVKTIDFHSGKELPLPPDWVLSDRHRATMKLLAFSPRDAKAILIDELTGSVIAEVAIGGNEIWSKFIADGEEILIASSDQRILRLDAKTGKILKIIDPYRFLPYLEILSSVAFFAWACLWLRFSANVHRHAWIDCTIITGLCIGYVILRARTTGFPADVIRPIYQFAEGIFAAWLILAALWLVLGRTRLSLRILPTIGIVGLVILLALICVGFKNPRVWELIIATVFLCLWLVVACIPLRLMGYKFLLIEPQVNGERQTSLAKGAIPIRDLFLLTTVLAGMFALGRFAPPSLQVTVLEVVNLFVLVLAVTFTGLAATRVGLSQKSFTARLLTLLVVAAIGMSLPFAWSAINHGWKAITQPNMSFLYWELRLHSSTALATALCLYAFRLRGWRLGQPSVNSSGTKANTF